MLSLKTLINRLKDKGMSDPINKNYSGNEAVHERRTGIRRIANERPEQSPIDPFHNLTLKQASLPSQAMLFSKPCQEKSFLPISSTSPQYCTNTGKDGRTQPATPGKLSDPDLETFGNFYSCGPVKSISQMIEEATDQLANGWIVADCNGRTRGAFPQNDFEVASQLIKELTSRTPSNMKEYPYRIKELVKLSSSEQLTAFRDEHGQTALEIAVGTYDFVSIWILIKKGASPSIGDKHPFQAIHVAAMKNYPELARLLIDRGADVNAVSHDGMTALDLALQHGYQDVVEVLANRGANLDIRSHGLTPLVWAIRNSTHPMVRILLKSGARINACGEKNRNPLMEAVLAGASKGEQTVAVLLKYLRDADESAPPPFDINQQTPEGHTALSLAYMMHGQLRKRADIAEKDMQEIIFLLQGNRARSDFLLNRYGIDYDAVLSEESMQHAARGNWGKEGQPNPKVAFTDAVKTFYDAKDQSYLSLLKNIPVSTKYEEKQEALRKSRYQNQ